MASGDNAWDDIKELRRDLKNLAAEGCGHKAWHEKVSEDLRMDLISERKDREHMGEYIIKEMKDMKETILSDTKAIRNQLLFGMIVLMALTLVIDKVLK